MVSERLNAGFPALRVALVAGLMVTALLGPAVAGPLEDSFEAYQRGDYAAAMRIARPLANQGIARAQEMVGRMYEQGQGVAQNYGEAYKWYRLAADKGNADAQFSLGKMYANGLGVPPNGREAYKWYDKAAEQGNANAQTFMGDRYSFGLGVPKNDAEAFKWYRLAAEQGHAFAQLSLGSMYHNGKGVPQNYPEAAKWYHKAAEQGIAAAQASLGYMYQYGVGVPQNYVQAHMWDNLAASGSASDPERGDFAQFRDLLANKMTPSQLTQAQVMAEQCLRSNYKDCGWPHVARREDEVTSPPTARNKVSSTGTAFFVSQTGHIVTNAHVVEGCQTVPASRGGSLRKVSVDNESDLALYIASEKSNAVARVRGGHGARVGEAVVTVGFPLTGLLLISP